MAYTPINWQNGDTITAEKMNKMDNGWSVSSTQLFNETVTTVADEDNLNFAQLSYTGVNCPETMGITFDGTNYICQVQSSGGSFLYGASNPEDWSDYPFIIFTQEGTWVIYTQTAGTHTVSAFSMTVEISDNFALSVKSASLSEVLIATLNVTTWQEIYDALIDGKIVHILKTSPNAYSAPVLTATYDGSSYGVSALYIDGTNLGVASFTADSADGPIYDGK